MSTWTTPATWVNGAVTAASMNTEIRDHANFLKGALDLLTNSTTADTGTATYLNIIRNAAAAQAFGAKVTGDTQLRLLLTSDGIVKWGSGAATQDATLERISAGMVRFTETRVRASAAASTTLVFDGLVTGDSVQRWTVAADGKMSWGGGSGAVDVTLYRPGAGALWVEGLRASGGIGTLSKAGIPSDADFEASMLNSGLIALDATNSRLYVRVGSTWKYAALT